MSLINQALRKAQHDRNPGQSSDAGSTPAQIAAASTNGIRPGLVIGLVITVAVLIGLVAGLSVVLLNDKAPAPAVVAQEQAIVPTKEEIAQPAQEALTVEPAPAAIKPITQQSAIAEDTLPLERETTSPMVDELRQAREAAEAKALAEAKAAEEKAAAEAKAAEEAAIRAAAKPNPEIIDWLARAVMSGVKLSDTGSKVILNGEPYALGEYVNFSLGIRVGKIEQKQVFFVDKNGKAYMKRL